MTRPLEYLRYHIKALARVPRLSLKFIGAFLIIIFTTPREALFAQNTQDVLIPYRDGKKWGLMNANDSLVLEVEYNETHPLINGRAKVKKGDLYGYVDIHGNMVVPPSYENASNFESYNVARVEKKGRSFLIDTSGNEHREFGACRSLSSFAVSNRIFRIGDSVGVINLDIDTVFQAKYKEIIWSPNGVYFFVTNHDNKMGVFDFYGTPLLDFTLDSVSFEERYSEFYLLHENNKIGALDNYHQLAAEIKYDNLRPYEYCLVTTLNKGQTGYIYQKKEYWKK